PNDPRLRFAIGSMTKAFTAAALLQLEEAGRLSMNDTLAAHFPGLPRHLRTLTLHQLLKHTAGLPDYVGSDEESAMRAPKRPERPLPDWLGPRDLRFTPGRKFEYSNSGYALLGFVIERTSGLGYEAYLRRHILTPLGMHSTRVDRNRYRHGDPPP